MNSSLHSTAPSPLSGKRVLRYFLLFFGSVIAVNIVLAHEAIHTLSGTVTDHPYERGNAYDSVVRAEEAQEKLGWKSNIALEKNVLHFTLRDASGKLLHPTSITAHFTRPTQASLDFDATLSGEATPIAFPAPGLWEVRIYAAMGDITFQHAQRLVAARPIAE